MKIRKSEYIHAFYLMNPLQWRLSKYMNISRAQIPHNALSMQRCIYALWLLKKICSRETGWYLFLATSTNRRTRCWMTEFVRFLKIKSIFLGAKWISEIATKWFTRTNIISSINYCWKWNNEQLKRFKYFSETNVCLWENNYVDVSVETLPFFFR